MTEVLIVGLVVIFGLTSVLGAVSLWAVHSRKYGRYRMRTPVQDPLPAGRKYLNMSLNGTLVAVVLRCLPVFRLALSRP